MDEWIIILSLVLLALIVYNIYKLIRVNPLSAADFPHVPAEKFSEWKNLELQSIYIFLSAIVVSFLLINVAAEKGVGLLVWAAFVVFCGGLIVAALRGSKAAKISKGLHFAWTRPVQVVHASPSAPSMELEFWQCIKDSKNPDDFKAYILKYRVPAGKWREVNTNVCYGRCGPPYPVSATWRD